MLLQHMGSQYNEMQSSYNEEIEEIESAFLEVPRPPTGEVSSKLLCTLSGSILKLIDVDPF